MQWFKDLKISGKLMLAFILVLAVSTAVSLIGMYNLNSLKKDMTKFNEKDLPGVIAVLMEQEAMRTMQRDLRQSLLVSTPEAMTRVNTSFESARKKAEENWTAMDKVFYTQEGKALLKEAHASFERWLPIVDSVRSATAKGDVEGAKTAMFGTDAVTIVTELNGHFEELVTMKENTTKKALEEDVHAADQAETLMVGTLLFAILLGLSASFLISRNLSSRISQVVGRARTFREIDVKNLGVAMEQMTAGNIHGEVRTATEPLPVDSKDELGVLAEAINGMLAQTSGSIASFRQVQAILDLLLKETEKLITAAKSGRLEVRGDISQLKGSFRELVEGINATLDAVMGPIQEASAVLEKVSAKDLSVRVTGHYQGDHAKIKNALNMAVQNLDEALTQVAIGTEQVTTAATQISSGSQGLSQSASEQASSLEETSSSLQELSSIALQNAANAREAKGLVESATQSTRQGVQVMQELNASIHKIKASSDATAKIVKTIDEIAFQTNLLALNAAVEAARAGDAGKGFAVVAEEVRNLAIRSAEAAKNTANMIEEAVKNAEAGVQTNQKMLLELNEITGKVEKVSGVMSEITAASDQQKDGVTQINKAVEQMNQVTQAVAANAEESASAAEELSGQSTEMMNMVGKFRLTGNQAVRHVQDNRFAHKPAAKSSQPLAKNRSVKPLSPAAIIPFDDGQDSLADF